MLGATVVLAAGAAPPSEEEKSHTPVRPDSGFVEDEDAFQWEALENSQHAAIALKPEDGEIVLCNKPAELLLGQSCRDVLGATLQDPAVVQKGMDDLGKLLVTAEGLDDKMSGAPAGKKLQRATRKLKDWNEKVGATLYGQNVLLTATLHPKITVELPSVKNAVCVIGVHAAADETPPPALAEPELELRQLSIEMEA